MIWTLSNRADPAAKAIADRHYNRQKPHSRQFVQPGRCLVLRSEHAVWVTSWPFAEYVLHEFGGAWINSLFRREAGPPASEMIREAVAITRWRWPEVPELGMLSFVNPDRVEHKREPGRVYRLAGFARFGHTKGGLHVWRMAPEDMPPPAVPVGAQELLALGVAG